MDSVNAHTLAVSLAKRYAAYTAARQDAFDLLQFTALNVHCAGCSNGAFGRSLKEANLKRGVSDIEFDIRFAQKACRRLDNLLNVDLNLLNWREGMGKWFTIVDACELISSCGLTTSSISASILWGDHGGGQANLRLNRLPVALKNWSPTRELTPRQLQGVAQPPVKVF